MVGSYNARNALAALIVSHTIGLETEKSCEFLSTFHTVKRRQEVRLAKDGVVLMEDFAHHPTAVRETLMAIKARYPGRKIWAVFEPIDLKIVLRLEFKYYFWV